LFRVRINTMNFQIDATPNLSKLPTDLPLPPAAATSPEVVDLLRQILEVQKEQLAYQRAAAAAHDMTSRWRSFLSRWQQDFPYLSDDCRKAMPVLEKAYGRMIAELAERLNGEDEPLDSDFALQDFLDRYGMRLAQLGTILNLVAPLGEAGSQGEAT